MNELRQNLPDIAANVKAVERAKSRMVSGVADVFEIMSGDNTDDLIEESLADVILNAYLLASKIGADFSAIDEIAVNKLKLLIINDDSGVFPYGELKDRLSGR